jgi:hypothetical protein
MLRPVTPILIGVILAGLAAADEPVAPEDAPPFDDGSDDPPQATTPTARALAASNADDRLCRRKWRMTTFTLSPQLQNVWTSNFITGNDLVSSGTRMMR